jgi:aspartate/methionine/tyrosine aminotransferase
VDPSEVVVTPGGKPIAFFSALACLEPGDEVICPNPGYPIFESVMNFAGAKVVPMPILEKDDFTFNCSKVAERITNRTKLIILNSPSNPTGGILTKEDLAEIAECVTSRKDLLVLSDEVYDNILYEGKHESIISAPGMKERTILLNSFSKTYAMTGWRLGYGVMRKDIARKITRLMVSSNSCTCAFVQMAGVEALRGPQDEVKKMVEEFKRRREIIISGLNKIEGVSCRKPSATFYAFPNVKNLGMNSKQLSDFLLGDAGVALLPGTAFGKYGEGYLRLSFANSIENIDKALNRISEAVARI